MWNVMVNIILRSNKQKEQCTNEVGDAPLNIVRPLWLSRFDIGSTPRFEFALICSADDIAQGN